MRVTGIQWHEAYDAIEAYDRLVVGRHSIAGSVGAAGGWVLGEGVTALFLLRSADLFWALLGGGGGTYGILTSMTYRTYPSLPVAAAVIVIKTVSANRDGQG